MHALFVRVTITDTEAATRFLHERVVPGVSQAPGFVTGHWTQWDEGSKGAAMMIFESEDAALEARGMVQPPPDGSAAIDSVEVAEVVASA
ncbi:MAG TPA: hypothetical protein VMY78_13460 [Solirubrobacteraceae bacterium]|nr:hypothetical protein [Solirubrobacteraceae bacterium]